MRKQVESWKNITDEEIHNILGKLIAFAKEIVPVDCDSDPVLELEGVDRRKYHRNPYFSVPYREIDGNNDSQVEYMLLINLATAIRDLQNFRQAQEYKKGGQG